MMETLGAKIRRQRRRLGLTLDELAGRAGISKPYLSLIETGRVNNPPSDEKLTRLEQSLGFNSGELLTQAHLQRTPRDVRAMLGRLLAGGQGVAAESTSPGTTAVAEAPQLTGALREWADRAGAAVEQLNANVMPVINRSAAGYPANFTGADEARAASDGWIASPELADPDAFAIRVCGDSMAPKYRPDDIVILSPASTPRHGDDCFICFTDGQSTFQRVFFESDNAAHTPVIRLQPRNERYRPSVLRPEQITRIYRAVFRYHRVDDE